MTVEEATRCVSLIQRAFPGKEIETRFYIRGLLKFDAETARSAILGAVEDEWRFMPTVYEMMETLRRAERREQASTCHHGVSFFEPCEKCREEAGP